MVEEAASEGAILEALVAALHTKAQYNRNEQVAPAAILWPDKECQWESLLPVLREKLPALLTLGDYQSEDRTGPAIWMRCMLACTLGEANWEEGEVPILYLPGLSRQELRAVESCPLLLQPLAELQYRGVFWSQLNSRDWTVFAFLKSDEGGLGLDVARGHQTQEALTRALKIVAATPIEQLRGRRLEASDFDALLSGDPVRDLLDWLDQPTLVRDRWGPEKWDAFRSRCQSDYGLDPQTDGELAGAERLCERSTPSWTKVWERFAEAPKRYPQIPSLLEGVVPQSLFAVETLPARNRQAEESLRQALEDLAQLPAHEAAQRIIELEREHGPRRSWVWAELNQAPLAEVLASLNRLATLAGTIPPLPTLEEAVRFHTETGWQVDAAVLDALVSVHLVPDIQAVTTAIRSVYGHWLEETVQALQQRIATEGYPGPQDSEEIPSSTCVLFADGIRLDVGQKLAALLAERGLEIKLDTRWTALPSVTSTAKPALSPVAHLISGRPESQDFQPEVAATGKPSTAANFRKLLQENDWQVLGKQELGTPDGRAWTEYGALDQYGHAQGWKLAWRIEEELEGLVERIAALLRAGWKRVRIHTDHGWLLYPGGLPKQDMPAYLTKTRWGRCAQLKDESYYAGPTSAWRWCDEMRVAFPSDIRIFFAGEDYSHGGLSLQECLVPLLTVTTGESVVRSVLEEPAWRRQRCRVTVTDPEPGMRVDLRTRPADASSSLVDGGKELDEEGKASLLVEDDSLESTAVRLVLLNAEDRVVISLPTTVGGEA